MESIENQINKSISNHKRGKLFFPNDFSKFGTSTSVRQALKRLEDKSFLIRLSHGIYLYPKKHKVLGVLYPTLDEIAIAIAKRDKARIIPTGNQALNKLGLSNQVPMNVVYLTDGAPRSIKVHDKYSIKFKKAAPKLLSAKNETIVLVIQALKELGIDKVDDVVLKKIAEIMKNLDVTDIKHDIKLAPVWIAEIIKKILEK